MSIEVTTIEETFDEVTNLEELLAALQACHSATRYDSEDGKPRHPSTIYLPGEVRVRLYRKVLSDKSTVFDLSISQLED